MKKQPIFTQIILLMVLFGALALLVQPVLVQAGPDLPPREPPATPKPDKKKDKADKPQGAYIELQLQPSQAGLWTAVQWQDSAGGWHNVEGWQGPPEGSSRQWWVEAKDFGKGPFRWTVTRGPGGPMAGVSASFNLPAGAGQQVQVIVVLK